MSLTLTEQLALNHVSPTTPHLGARIEEEITAMETASIAAVEAQEALSIIAVTDQEALSITAVTDQEALSIAAVEAVGGKLIADYAFGTHGGAIGTIDLGVVLPEGAIITNVKSDVTTPFTSGGSATIALKAATDAMIAATAYGHASLTGIDDHTVANLKTAAEVAINFVIAGADLTAGEARFIIEWVQGLV